MSLQHELIHGHPTRLAWFNQLLGTLPLAVWYPYGVYRDSHLAHHRNHLLTHPEDDPESYYVTAESWQKIQKDLRRKMQIDVPGTGIAFIVPLSSIGGKRALMFLTEHQPLTWKEESTLKDTRYELLLVIANQGYTGSIIVDAFDAPYAPQPVQYFLTEGVLRRWRYSPPECSRVVETVFGE
mgnify:CR=1 FL=1